MKTKSFKDIIIFEDSDFIVINKPEHIASLDDRSSNISILSMAREYCQDASLCHRLDKETSGALIIAKNAEAYRHASMQFEHREVHKVYHALVDGIANFDMEEVSAPIKASSKGIVHINHQEGKAADTLLNTLKVFRHHTLVSAVPFTGRMHQIRIHLSMKGHPIVCDETYGGKPFYLSTYKRNYKLGKFEEEQSVIKRVALHAYSIGFFLLNKEEIFVEAPYPKDMRVVLKQAEKFSSY